MSLSAVHDMRQYQTKYREAGADHGPSCHLSRPQTSTNILSKPSFSVAWPSVWRRARGRQTKTAAAVNARAARTTRARGGNMATFVPGSRRLARRMVLAPRRTPARRARPRGVRADAHRRSGERSHLLNADIDLDTHILNIVNLIKWQQLTDVVLVGHSYGGLVISGAAEEVGPAVATFVMLDAFHPEDGQSTAWT